MEEESEKRRERLRAMRTEANEVGNSSSFASPELPCLLSNPLTESPAQEEPRSNNTRFDFYTDPMSAFSADKRRNAANPPMPSEFFRPSVSTGSTTSEPPFMGPRSTEPTPRAHQHQYQYQYQGNYSPRQQMYQPRARGHNPVPHRSPMGGVSRPYYNAHHGNQNYPIGPGNAAGYNNYNPPPRRPGFGPTGRPFNGGQGRGNWVYNSPSPGQGQSGWRGGQGLGSGSGGRSSGPERFYSESMVEDPWKFLDPVIWREEVIRTCPDFSKFSAPSTLGAKKARVSDSSNKVESQPSLAEYLAASFNEAVDDAPTD